MHWEAALWIAEMAKISADEMAGTECVGGVAEFTPHCPGPVPVPVYDEIEWRVESPDATWR